ncbi:MAG: oligosaccharide flippase family protein [Pseudomonadota bacterium]
MRAKRSFLRDVMPILTGRIAVQIASFITGIIIARVLGVEGKGLIAAVILAPQMIITIAEFGVRNAAAFHIGRETWPVEKIVETTLATAFLTSLIGMALCFGWLWLTWEDGYTPLIVVFACLVVPGAIVYTYIAGIFLGLQRIDEFTVSNWAPGISKLFGTAFFVGALGFGTAGAVGAMTLSVLLVAAIMLSNLSLFVPLRVRFTPEIARKMTGIGSSFAVVYFMMVMVYKANIFLVQQFGSIEQLGFYSLSSNLAELLWQIPAVMSALVFARSAAAKDEAKFSLKVAMLARLTFLIGMIGAVIAALLARTVIPLIYGEAFAPSADIFVVLLPGVVAMVVFKILRQDLSGRGTPWAASWIIVPMLASTIILGALFIPTYGAMGAAISMSSVYVVGTLGFIVLYARVTHLPLKDLVLYRKSDFTTLKDAFTRLLNKRRKR